MDINSDPSVFEVRIRKEKGVRSDRLILRFTLLGDENEPFARPIINPHQVELNMITYWWKTCESEHGDCCRPLLRSVDVSKPGVDASIANFKVIDVRTSRVVIAPVECTYIALSYVWGNIQAFRLKRADMVLPRHSTRSSGGSYAQLDRQELPRTIRDAMFVVEALGERYLWVDSLCIIQDDQLEMKTMIHGMDRIFKAATLTIIAASGGDAYAGLPGLYPGSRYIQPVTGSVEGVGLVGRRTFTDIERLGVG
jgi:hypothetical protein